MSHPWFVERILGTSGPYIAPAGSDPVPSRVDYHVELNLTAAEMKELRRILDVGCRLMNSVRHRGAI